jgi:uncharacterized protein (TIGR00369 family)
MTGMADLDAKLGEALRLDNPTGFSKFLDLRYSELSGELVAAELDVRSDFLQPTGIVHGGIYAAVVETLPSIGGSLWLAGKGYCVGVHNSTHFLRPTRSGTLSARGVPVFQGTSQQLWRVEITNEEGKLASIGELRVHNIYSAPSAGEG